MASSTAHPLLLDPSLLQWEIKDGLRVLVGTPGAFGVVYKALYAKQPVAVKHVDISVLNGTLERQEAQFLREVDIQHKLRHKHVVSLIGALIVGDGIASEKRYYIVMELLRGSLHSLVLKPTGILHTAPPKERIRWLCECAKALTSMHAQTYYPR
jgi:serine/threonine protein kinase